MKISALNPDLDSVATAGVIVISYIILPQEDSTDSEIIFNAHPALVKQIEKLFGIELRDELSFFSPTGKAGELNEIPVSAEDSPVEKIILLAHLEHQVLHSAVRHVERERILQLLPLLNEMKLSPLHLQQCLVPTPGR